MTTPEDANPSNHRPRTSQGRPTQDELFADNAVSIEPENSPGLKTGSGRDAISQKAKEFDEAVEEMHGGYSSQPQVGGNHFAVAMGMDATMKGQGRVKMDEIAVYGVKDGKIVKEQ